MFTPGTKEVKAAAIFGPTVHGSADPRLGSDSVGPLITHNQTSSRSVLLLARKMDNGKRELMRSLQDNCKLTSRGRRPPDFWET